jgi:uncharacterized protein (TIGR02646 family)
MIALIRPECPNPNALANGNYKDKVNKDALRKSASGKCMYCEGKIEHVSYFHVEHINPKKKFPELEFEWNNLGFSCQVCNTNKGDKYDEQTPFINPYNENPEEHLVFLDHIVFPKHGSKRGKYTIDEIDLNRANLIERRKDKKDGIDKIIEITLHISSEILKNQLIEELKKEAEKDKEYSAMIKSILIANSIYEK